MADNKKTEGNPPAVIQFTYTKGAHYRVIHVDGAWGGITPDLNIHMGMFCQRLPYPKRIIHGVVDGNIGPEIQREADPAEEGIIREIEADVVMTADVARSIIKWLQDKVDTIQNLQQAAEREENN